MRRMVLGSSSGRSYRNEPGLPRYTGRDLDHRVHRDMDFLLECIGFPPDQDHSALTELVRAEGEAVPWRGDPDNHRRLPLGGGLEPRLDRDPGQEFWTLLPAFRVPHRLRVAVESLRGVPDSPFDALLTGWACPPTPGEESSASGEYLLTTWLTDARRLPRRTTRGHVLAVSVAGFALNVDYVGPNEGVKDPGILEGRRGAHLQPLGGAEDPGGCMEVSARVQSIRHMRNAVTGLGVELLVCDAPERPLLLFVSPWQLSGEGRPAPRPGWRIEGTFLFSGVIAGGLTGPKGRARRGFG